MRLVKLSDAVFINSLRIDKRYNQYLSFVNNNIAKQEEWLIKYKEKEKLGNEFYYIILRCSDSFPIGTVRIYDFIGDKESFSWGSWILNHNKTRYAALETALLIYDIAFVDMKFKRCHMEIRKGNKRVIEFHKRFGVKIIGETKENYLGYYFPEDYLKIRKSIKSVIDG